MKSRLVTIAVAFVTGGIASVVLFGELESPPAGSPPAASSANNPAPPEVDVVALQKQVELLKKVVSDQAHAMSDVDYHFANLWFAAKAENWPLADFLWKESLSHMRWAVRIIPVRKDNAGREVKLEEILESIENSPHLQMGDVIKEQDHTKFETTYRHMLEACYACHKASDKPYLRPQIPEQPASRIINFDPQATWPR